ncbi:hypothetical protein FRB97_006283 [Tulasnella sp. 331]|nr:hypothetical protein FRB97_006283 [Tulasnella sp. 331]
MAYPAFNEKNNGSIDLMLSFPRRSVFEVDTMLEYFVEKVKHELVLCALSV